MRRAFRLLPIPFSIALALPAMAEDGKPENWGLCRVQDPIPAFQAAGAPAAAAPAAANAAQARAEREQLPTAIAGDALSGQEGDARYQGNVELTRGDQLLQADNLKFQDETYVADGHVRYQDSGIRLIAERAQGNQGADTHRIENVQYQLVDRRGNGGADFIELAGADGALHGSTYTTCDPQDPHWALKSRRIDINTDKGWGVAHGATIRVGQSQVPVLYVPYFRFPIDDHRQTGLLYPTFSTSGRNGFDYRQPLYLNLAPNYDATLTPRYMSERGVLLDAQFRYLYEGGRGTVDGSWISHDDLVDERAEEYANGEEIDLYDDPLRADNRGMLQFEGYHNVNSHWQARANAVWVSDERYLEDVGNSLYGLSSSLLESEIGLYGQGENWDGGLMVDAWQLSDYTLTDSVLPYDRLPRLYLNWEKPILPWLTVGARTEVVNFDHTESDKGGGSRLDLKPYVSMPLSGPSWFVTPTLAWRYTAYQLDDTLEDQLGDKNPTRSLPIGTLDAGLFFDRDTEIDDEPYLHTLEPRLFYVNAPYRDQDELPLFDTRAFTYSWGQLFRDNRYSGPDRQTDANQLTLALSSRLIRQSDGKEKFSASLGQILYFEDSRVVLPGETPVEDGKSAWVADANYSPADRWTIGASYQWDPKYRRQDLASVRARYLIGDDGVVNLGYRYRRDLLEQADFSFLYPLNPSWSLVGRYYYSIFDNKPLETLAGVQWDSCCLAVRVVARRYVRNREGDLNNSLGVEFVLKGLGSAGQDTERTLRRGILGYYRDDLYLVPPSNVSPDPDDSNSGPDSIL